MTETELQELLTECTDLLTQVNAVSSTTKSQIQDWLASLNPAEVEVKAALARIETLYRKIHEVNDQTAKCMSYLRRKLANPEEEDYVCYEMQGGCNCCGECCRGEFISDIMLTGDNVIDGQLYCDHLCKDESTGKLVCKFIGEMKKVPELAEVDLGKILDVSIVPERVLVTVGMTFEQAKWCALGLNWPQKLLLNFYKEQKQPRDWCPSCGYQIVAKEEPAVV